MLEQAITIMLIGLKQKDFSLKFNFRILKKMKVTKMARQNSTNKAKHRNKQKIK
jgi:hypothetical protein